MPQKWIKVMVRIDEYNLIQYDQTQSASWAEHLQESARKEYPNAMRIYSVTEEKTIR